MPLERPSSNRLSQLSGSLDGADASVDEDTVADLFDDLLSLYDRAAELEAPTPLRPADPDRRTVDRRPGPHEDRLNAWVTRYCVSGNSNGVMAGKDVAVKDNVSIAGIPMTCGSRVMQGYTPDVDAPLVSRLLDAGGTLVGTTNMTSFAFSGTGDLSAYGPMLNPHDEAHLAGGSSGGSAAAVADGAVDVAIGGDQGGSIRVPAAWSGCVGLKPTFGLVPYTGVFPLEPSVDHVGPLGRTVEDVARCLAAIAGADGFDPRQCEVETVSYLDALDADVDDLTVGVLEQGFGHENSDAAVDAAVRDAIGVLEAEGAETVPVSVEWHHDAGAILMPIVTQGVAAMFRVDGIHVGWQGHYDSDLAAVVRNIRQNHEAELNFNMRVTLALADYLAEQYGLQYYARAQNLRRPLRAAYDRVLESVDLLALPTTPHLAYEYEEDDDPVERFGRTFDPSANTFPFNLTGQPAVSVPCAKRDGLPVGLMLVGDRFDDATVLAAARAFEAATDWESR